MHQTIKYKGENTLSYAEYGNKNGDPILIQHGMIASISDYHLFDRLIGAGRRLVCIARPGYGSSSPYQMENMAEWGEIVSILVETLALGQFDVFGMSSGAPYSYAIGYKLPDKTRNIYIFSGTPALYDEQVLKLWPYPVKRDASIAEMKEVAQEVFFSHLTDEDKLRDDIRDSLMNDCFGVAQDLRIRIMDWGFTLSELNAVVSMEHSKTDQEVPFVTAEITAGLIQNCRLSIREGKHFSAEALDRFIRNRILETAARKDR